MIQLASPFTNKLKIKVITIAASGATQKSKKKTEEAKNVVLPGGEMPGELCKDEDATKVPQRRGRDKQVTR